MAKTVKRPGFVTFLGILGFVSGTLKVLFGVVVLLDTNRMEFFKDANITNSAVVAAAVVAIIAGLLTLFVANAILSGQKWAQLWYGLLMTFSLVANLVSTFVHSGSARWGYLGTALIAFIALQVLFSERSQAYFEED